MVDIEKFRNELFDEFLQQHPELKAEDSVLALFAKIFAELAAAAIAKYDREALR